VISTSPQSQRLAIDAPVKCQELTPGTPGYVQLQTRAIGKLTLGAATRQIGLRAGVFIIGAGIELILCRSSGLVC
jgi:hypothetical protein